MKNIAVLGSTGSIGTNTLRVIKSFPDKMRVAALAANSSIELLSRQAEEFECEKVVCSREFVSSLEKTVPKNCKVLPGIQGMVDIVTSPEVDIVLCAVVGTHALLPVLEAIRAGKDIAIASKEILVMAGEIVMSEARKYGVKMLPVDSEHSAIFQCLQGADSSDISKIILTASGGAFRDSSIKEINNATLSEALNHPTWDMGPKVTIDSASLMNKALEIIEAKWLFDVSSDQIDVVIHPQSIIHSMVEFLDGTVIAQLSTTDMKFPIQYALTYPDKYPGGLVPLDFRKLGQLNFREPDRKIFPSLDYAFEALNIGGTTPCVLNAANESAVSRFSENRIKFPEIWRIVKVTMDAHKSIKNPSLEDILAADKWARDFAMKA